MTKKTFILLGFIFLKFILQYFLLSSEYDLQRDEYLHLDQGQHLAWGFQSVPPFTSWVSYLIHLLGNSVFWIKFFPALFGALTIFVVWKAIEELNGNLFALILGATCILFSALLRLNTLYQPNSFDVLSWTTFYFVVIKYFKTENTKWLFISAVVFAFGFLNKYNVVFLIIGLLPAILLTEQRKMFAKKELYFSILVGLLIVLPNLIWQYKNNFPVIHHLNELAETQLVNVDRLNFLKSQLLFYIGSIAVIFSSFYALLFHKPFRKYKPFFFSILFTLIAFVYFKAKDYYAIGIYPIYIAFGSVYIADLLKSNWKIYLKPIAIAIPILLFIPIFNVAFPNKSPEYIVQHSEKYEKFGFLRWEDGKNHELPQDFADMLGWEELALKVDRVYSKLPNKEKTLVLCDNYGQAGAINYYTKQNIKAVSFNADYIDWFDLTKNYENLIRIKEANETDAELKETSPFFETSLISGSIANKYSREFGTTIFAFTGAKIDIKKRIKDEIDKKKNYR
ncbi:glycosyltransferase family 39 protein [Flavobacterium geliluteum]|uniref:Glycosyltransferase family 39 protein n=1 Tax=Flavobacterium geliluteum TaxID=2816120 RepID=A0A940XDG2_9FLAO|nr:glycosyltransferase family 39 protein [Flavobacterium geliluteum]MBP4139926.1 glycosyltransferase family 39 protein [Flavobacterium geliluteum]